MWEVKSGKVGIETCSWGSEVGDTSSSGEASSSHDDDVACTILDVFSNGIERSFGESVRLGILIDHGVLLAHLALAGFAVTFAFSFRVTFFALAAYFGGVMLLWLEMRGKVLELLQPCLKICIIRPKLPVLSILRQKVLIRKPTQSCV